MRRWGSGRRHPCRRRRSGRPSCPAGRPPGGERHKAWSPDLGRPVALKCLLDPERAQYEDVTRFKREAQSTSKAWASTSSCPRARPRSTRSCASTPGSLGAHQVWGFVDVTTTCTDLRGLAAVRKAEFERLQDCKMHEFKLASPLKWVSAGSP